MEGLFQRDSSQQTKLSCKHRNTGIAVLGQINSPFSSVASHLTEASIRCFRERMKKSLGEQLKKSFAIKFLSNSHHLLDGSYPVTEDFLLVSLFLLVWIIQIMLNNTPSIVDIFYIVFHMFLILKIVCPSRIERHCASASPVSCLK